MPYLNARNGRISAQNCLRIGKSSAQELAKLQTERAISI